MPIRYFALILRKIISLIVVKFAKISSTKISYHEDFFPQVVVCFGGKFGKTLKNDLRECFLQAYQRDVFWYNDMCHFLPEVILLAFPHFVEKGNDFNFIRIHCRASQILYPPCPCLHVLLSSINN